MALEVLPATAARFDDVATLLGRGDKACWCLYWRLASGEYDRVPDRPAKVRQLLAGDPAPGLLAYLDGTVVGWCGLGPRAQMGRLIRSRAKYGARDVERYYPKQDAAVEVPLT